MASTAVDNELLAAPHPWSSSDPASLEKWVNARLGAHQRHLDDLLSVAGTRTFENTLRPFDDAQTELASAGQQTALMDSVHPDKDFRDRAQAMTQKVAQAAVALSLNADVYQALTAIDLAKADPATRHYLERTLLQYRLAGVDKDAETRGKIKELQDRATALSLAFGRNVQENVNKVTVTGQAELDGLPADYLTAHPPGPDGSITLTTDFPDMQPVMTYARSADLRRRMFLAYSTRAYPQNKQLLLDLLAIRQQIATLLGYETWADLATADQMMQSAANMKAFLSRLDEASKAGAEREYQMVLDFARKEQPGLDSIDLAGTRYWYEQYRRAAYDFDSQSVRPYFPYDTVQSGILEIAARLFHVQFIPVKDAELWHASATAWDVFDAAEGPAHGKQIGRFYLDMHPREGKDKWFSAAPLIPGIAGRQYPEAALVCNFPGDKPGDPGLMQYSDVVTFFHEFGHLMHAILGGQQPWAGVSGITTEGDFVEAPSQMLEEFFRDPELLASFARHYQTGEPIPAQLVERMNRASAFGRADWLRTQLVYTSYSLDTHNTDPAELDLDALLYSVYARFSPYSWIEGNRFYASFTHLTGYTSNYYTYLWDKVIALDFFSAFDRDDLLDGPAALKYRRMVLEPGGSKPGKQLVHDFLGREQEFEAFQSWIGEEFQPDGTSS